MSGQERGRKASRSRSPGKSRRSKSGGGSGRSSSSSRSRSGSPDKSGRKDKKKKKKNKKGKRGKDKGEKSPNEWSQTEFLERIGPLGKFELNRMTGRGILACSGIRLNPENLAVICECFRRHSEVQLVSFKKCFVSDDIFATLCASMQNLRHLKQLNMTQNILTSVAVERAINDFAGLKRSLEELDFRENMIDVDDGTALYEAFKHSIVELNGVPIKATLKDRSATTADLRDRKLKLPEVAIVCGVMVDSRHLERLNLSNNFIDSKGALLIAETIPKCKSLRYLDISKNPMTNRSTDDSGVSALRDAVGASTKVLEMNIRDCGADPKLVENTERSAMVNRSVDSVKHDSYNFFTKYINTKLDKLKQKPPENPYEHLEPAFEIDPDWIRRQKLNEMQVVMRPNEIVLQRKINGPHGFGAKF